LQSFPSHHLPTHFLFDRILCRHTLYSILVTSYPRLQEVAYRASKQTSKESPQPSTKRSTAKVNYRLARRSCTYAHILSKIIDRILCDRNLCENRQHSIRQGSTQCIAHCLSHAHVCMQTKKTSEKSNPSQLTEGVNHSGFYAYAHMPAGATGCYKAGSVSGTKRPHSLPSRYFEVLGAGAGNPTVTTKKSLPSKRYVRNPSNIRHTCILQRPRNRASAHTHSTSWT
jgi:hypothetical protein